MAQLPPPTPSSTPFETIFLEAVKKYEKKTKKDLASHPLAAQLQSCNTPEAIIALLQAQVQVLDRTQGTDEKLTRWLDPTVNVLCAFSETIGNAVGLAFPPATVIFSGIGVLLQAVKRVRASRQALVGLFDRIGYFFTRLKVYTEVRPTEAMEEILVKIMAEVLSILGMVTKEIGEGLIKKYFKRLVGWKGAPVEDAMQKLDSLTRLAETPMAIAETLMITHNTDSRVEVVQENLKGVNKSLESVGQNVQGIDNKMQSVKDELHGVGDKVNSVIESGKDTKVAIQKVESQVSSLNRSESRENLHRWISPPDPSNEYNTTCDAQHEGTAAWCTKSNTFADWKRSGSLLWVHGKPGSGKTFLSSAIIREIKNTLSDSGKAHIAFFYFDAEKDSLDFRALLSSLLFQLFGQSDQFSCVLRELYSKYRTEKPPISSLVQCLKDMLSLAGQPPIYLVFDALDECPDSGMPPSREKVLDLVEELVGLRHPNLRLCVTSRPEYDIRSALEPMATQHISLHDEPGQKKDIENYVDSVIRSMNKWTVEDQDMVIKTLEEKADGMFRWVFRQLEDLRHWTRPKLRRTLDSLEELPGRLDETYERILRGISDSDREPTNRLLQCLTVAARPLRVEELAELFAIDFNTGGTNTGLRWDDHKDAVLSACASLVSVFTDGGNQVVRFWHFSVKEYLTSDRLAKIKELSQFHIPLEHSHATLAHLCFNILLRLDDHTERDAYPLLLYAAECWVKHAQFKDVELRPDIQSAMDAFFETTNPHFSAWVRIQHLHDLLDVPANSDKPVVPSAAPLYLAAYYGLRGPVGRMIAKHPEHVSARSGEYGTALHASIQGGHTDVAELLLEHGADVNAPGTYSVTPLHVASRHGRLDAVKWLLDLNPSADVNAKRVDGQTALHSAAVNGHLGVAQELLKHNADVGARDVEGCTPLSFALEGAGGRLDLVRLLLDRNADVNTRDNSGRTPLHYAAAFGYLEVAQLLLERKAKCNAQDDEGSTPLHRASDAAEVGLMQLLLDHGADANARDNVGDTSLHQAAINTLPKVARILLEYNTEVNARNNCGSTPLHLASEEGELDFVSLLLDYGADVQVRDDSGNTPLQIASANGHRGIVRVLLDHEVEDDAQSDYTSTPSHFTSEEGDFDAVCASLDRFAEAQVRNNGGKSSSEVVGDSEEQRIVQLLSPEMNE